MDDLQTLASLLDAPEPSAHTAERSLLKLQRHMRRPRRTAWAGAALSLTAAAAAAVVVVSGTAGPTATPHGPPSAAVRLNAGQVLLAAASTAEREPEGSGAYWYVRTESKRGWVDETWYGRQGGTWLRGEKTSGKVVELVKPAPFRLGGLEVGFEQLEKLPAEPEALTKWISEGIDRGGVRTSAGRLDEADKARAVFSGLVALVSQLPAAPEVRAAAFRALATYPGVESLGPVEGGEALLITDGIGEPARLVVDPATSRVRDSDFFVSADGGVAFSVKETVSITAQWTDILPN